jgi:hypothetical protein
MNNKWMVFVGVGFEAVGVVLASVWLGQWLDTTYNFKGLFTIVFCFVGLGGWFAHIVFLIKKLNKQ